MSDENKFIGTGTVNRKSPVRKTQKGLPVVNFSFKCGKMYVDVTAWGKHAEANYTDGTGVRVEGELSVTSYEKDGKKVWKHYINASSVTVIDRATEKAPADDDDNIPF